MTEISKDQLQHISGGCQCVCAAIADVTTLSARTLTRKGETKDIGYRPTTDSCEGFCSTELTPNGVWHMDRCF